MRRRPSLVDPAGGAVVKAFDCESTNAAKEDGEGALLGGMDEEDGDDALGTDAKSDPKGCPA